METWPQLVLGLDPREVETRGPNIPGIFTRGNGRVKGSQLPRRFHSREGEGLIVPGELTRGTEKIKDVDFPGDFARGKEKIRSPRHR